MMFTKFKRGSIWYYKDDVKSPVSKGVQSYSRPVLIISNDKFNSYSPVVNVLKLTSVDKDKIMHIGLKVEGSNNINFNHIKMNDCTYILVEQIDTLPVNKLLEYLGQVSDEVMDMVEQKLCSQLCFTKNSKLSVTKLKEFMDKYINATIHSRVNSINSADLINELKNNINQLVDNQLSDINKNITRTTLTTNTKEHTTPQKHAGRQTRYTDDDKIFILNNYPHNKEMLMQVYNKNSSQLSKLFFYIKNTYKQN